MGLEKQLKSIPEDIWSTHSFSNQEIDYKSFPIQSQPFPNELFTSWLCRVAHANYTNYSGILHYLLEKHNILEKKKSKHYLNRDLDKNCPIEIINTISKETGLKIITIESLTLKIWKGKITAKKKKRTMAFDNSGGFILYPVESSLI